MNLSRSMHIEDRERRPNLQLMEGSEKGNNNKNQKNSNNSRKLSKIKKKRKNPFVTRHKDQLYKKAK